MSDNKKTMSQKLARQAPPPPVGSVKLLSLKPGEAFLLLNEYGFVKHPGIAFILMGAYQPLFCEDSQNWTQHWGMYVPCFPYGRLTNQADIGQSLLIRYDADVIPVRLKPEPVSLPLQE